MKRPLLATLEELDHQQTPLGELLLLRRRAPSLPDRMIHEARLGGEFLVSSLIHHSEVALARLALAELPEREWDILVGGLGLGYTAHAALDFPNTRSVTVVEYLEAVIAWHRRELVPTARDLIRDSRCRFLCADFFRTLFETEAWGGSVGLLPDYDAILVDIDHSPACWIHPSHARFYTAEGLGHLARRLRSGGVFSLWSADPPDPRWVHLLESVFPEVRTCPVEFFNPLTDEDDSNSIYIARSA